MLTDKLRALTSAIIGLLKATWAWLIAIVELDASAKGVVVRCAQKK